MKRKALSNSEAIQKLIDEGLITYNNLDKSDCFSKPFKIKNVYHYYQYYRRLSYMIPLDIWKTYINKKFRPQFKVGEMVRISNRSTRSYPRNRYIQDVGDSQDFRHLGIGSGKSYKSDKIKTLMSTIPRYLRTTLDAKLLIGNLYPCNMASAASAYKYVTDNNIKKENNTYSWMTSWTIRDFLDFVKIEGSGVLGPKKKINGYITNVYVHFLYPK
jgi:hypothetical protein